jgi:high-affinity iron transporter
MMYSNRLKKTCLLIFWLLLPCANLIIWPAWGFTTETRQLLQLAEYIGVDYPSAVKEGEVIDSGEYQEMQNFISLILSQGQALPQQSSEFIRIAQQLKTAIDSKAAAVDIHQLTNDLRSVLLTVSPQLALPKTLLERSQSAQLYQQNCTACHGLLGKGNGPLSHNLEPSPTDFTNRNRAYNRSIMGLYDAITHGLEGTAMKAFTKLNTQDRWSLAFFVGSLAFEDKLQTNPDAVSLSIENFISLSPNTLTEKFPQLSLNSIESLRLHPNRLFEIPQTPLLLSLERLKASEQAYLENNTESAQYLAVSAYLDGFELVENTLNSHNSELRKQIEAGMLAMRQQVAIPGQANQVRKSVSALEKQLKKAEAMLDSGNLSDTAIFSASFIILLREGLEALLVILVLLTVLKRAQRKDATRYVHLGWVTALVAGIATWWAAQSLIDISGASREMMEGFAAILAALVLFYVGFWMHSKAQAGQWQAYIQKHIQKHLSQGSLLGLAGLSFISVYREVFETVLFYQSLLTQAAPQQIFSIGIGFCSAFFTLALLAYLIIHFSVSLPLGRFFMFSTYLMLVLSFVLAGKGILALQEAAVISRRPFPLAINLDWLGIHATWEGLVIQVLILFIPLGFLFYTRLKPVSKQDTELITSKK